MNTISEKVGLAADYVRPRLAGRTPRIGIILGSGLGGLADEMSDTLAIGYGDIPGFAVSTVHGHASRLVMGQLAGCEVLVMQGRFHYYEGHDMAQVALPVRVMRALGVQTLIVTNAAGGLNPEFRPGDLMVITDHIFLPGMAGANPLRGPNDEKLGPRFPGMVNAYSDDLLKITEDAARLQSIRLQRGTYLMLAGPNFETRAEMRMLRGWGADAVGMSTVPEVLVAVHGGMRVIGISTITNSLNPDSTREANHLEVLDVGREAGPSLAGLIKAILPKL